MVPKAVKVVEGAVVATRLLLDAETKVRIEDALKECAEQARSEVLLRRFGGRSPTPEDCREQVGVDSKGERVIRAMQFGQEMHEIAFRCVRERLGKLLPGGFSVEPRYRYDQRTGTTTLISPCTTRP